MSRQLNREYPEPDEVDISARMSQLTVEHMKPIKGHLRRGQHAKATGCVRATFEIRADVQEGLRHGVFARTGRAYEAIVRISNAQDSFEKDGKGTARGLAIKLLEIDGPCALDDNTSRDQDFLMVDHPVFPFPNPRAYLDAIQLKSIRLIGNLAVGVHLALTERDEFAIIKAILNQHVANPLELTYWSGSPFWLGAADGIAGHAVKYSAVPREAPTPRPSDPEDVPYDYLSQALAAWLRQKEAVFDFKVQLQTDPIAMPIEDVSVEWDETLSKPVTVAKLRIPPQTVESSRSPMARTTARHWLSIPGMGWRSIARWAASTAYERRYIGPASRTARGRGRVRSDVDSQATAP